MIIIIIIFIQGAFVTKEVFRAALRSEKIWYLWYVSPNSGVGTYQPRPQGAFPGKSAMGTRLGTYSKKRCVHISVQRVPPAALRPGTSCELGVNSTL